MNMSISQKTRQRIFWALAVVSIAMAAGCAPHGAPADAPPGTKVGGPLTQAQIQTIQQKRAGQQGN